VAITFENTSNTPNETVLREIDITVTDSESLASNTATTTIQVIDLPNAAPALDLDVLDNPNIEPNENAGVIPLNISDPINIITDADGNTIQATYSSVATVNGVTIDLVATLNDLEIIEPSTSNNPSTEFVFRTTPFTNDATDPDFGQLNANNSVPGDFGRAEVTYSLVDQATGNPVPLPMTMIYPVQILS